MGLGTFLGCGIPSRLSDGVLTISFAKGNGFSIEIICRDKKIITDILQEKFGKPFDLECVIDEAQVHVPNVAPKEVQTDFKKLDVERLYEKEPIVKKIVDDFEGEIIQE